MPVPAAEAEALPRSSSSLAVAACSGRLPAPRTLSRKAAIHSTLLKTHECFACKTSNAFIWRISAIIKLARRQNKQKISRVLFHLLSLFLPVRSLKHCYNIAPQRIPAAPRTKPYTYLYIHPYRSVSAYHHAAKFDNRNSSYYYTMATTRVIKLQRDDDESAHVLIQIAQKGSKPLDVKLVGTEGEAPYVATCTVSPSAKSAR